MRSIGLIATIIIISASVAWAAPNCNKQDILCVGLVTDVGDIDDRSFNQAAWEGVELAAEKLKAHIKYIETRDAKDYEENIALFTRNGYDVIVTVGFALGEASSRAAKKHPNIAFIGVDQFQTKPLPNLSGLVFQEDQGGFLAGALAAMVSRTGTIGAVLGTNLVPPIVNFRRGFEAGARYVREDIKVISTYHPGGLDMAFTDPEWGAATAKQAIDQGADVLFGAGGKTGNGCLVETATHKGRFCIGVDQDQWETLPAARACLISSAVKHIRSSVFSLIQDAVKDTFPGGNYYGEVGLAPFHTFDSIVTTEMKETLNRIEAGLRDGSIRISTP